MHTPLPQIIIISILKHLKFTFVKNTNVLSILFVFFF